MSEQDDSQKTEDPTRKRIEDSRKKGQVGFSREVSSFLILLVITILVVWNSAYIFSDLATHFYKFIESPHDIEFSGKNIMNLFHSLLISSGKVLILPVILFIFVIFTSSIVQNGIIFSADPMKPKLEKISIPKGFKRLFSAKAVIEFIKGIFKITTVGTVGIVAVSSDIPLILGLHEFSLDALLPVIRDINVSFLYGVLSVMLVIAGLDLLYQKYSHHKSMKMSKQEIKDEFKQTEGSPEIKSKLRKLRQEAVKKQMMKEVPKADVVITNPTHYAIALKYDVDTMVAPKIIAKGRDKLAEKIKKVAKENKIPIVENKPLAQALYKSVEVDHYVPEQHYKAVAEVINYVYNLKGKKQRAT